MADTLSGSDKLMNTYGRLPVSFVRGEGIWLEDSDGQRYLDALSGIAVCGLGHSHPAVSQTLAEQGSQLLHTSNLYNIENQNRLGEKLTDISGMDRVFFGNSGAEANECAIKIARRYGDSKNIDNPTIIVMEGSFHGRTLATLSATGNDKVRQGFGPLPGDFIRVPYNNIEAITPLQDNNNIVAILVEPVQGEGGIQIPDSDYLSHLRSLCDANQWLLMLDEIQTGNGRTGHYFAYQEYNWHPDVVTTAKGLGNGIPIGACLARGQAAELLQPGMHGTTYGGNPLCCAVALSVMGTIEQQNLCARADHLGNLISQYLTEALKHESGVVEIRHKGLLLAIELDRPCSELVKSALDAHLLINVTADNNIRLLPPLIMSDHEAKELVSRLVPVITRFLKSNNK